MSLNLNKKQIIILALMLSFITKFIGFSKTPIFPDEITWMVRAKETFLALRTFNIDHINTYFQSDNAWWNIKDDTQAIAIPLVYLSGPLIAYLGIGQSILSRDVLPDYIVARIPVIIINSFSVVLVYLLAEKLTDKRIAAITTLLFTVDPMSIAYSRILLNDGFLMLFILLGIYSFFYLKSEKLSIALSGIALALGFMSKPHAVLLIIAWFLFYLFSKNKKGLFKKIVLSSIVSVVIILLLWPESWYHPVISIFEYLVRQTSLVSKGMTIYFMGKVTTTPPFYYYIYLTLVRLPSYLVLGLIVYIAMMVNWLRGGGLKRENISKYRSQLTLFIFSLIFISVITISTKKSGVRYMLPLWPFFYIASVWAINKLLVKLDVRKIVINTIFAVFFLVGVYNYSLYYSSYDYYYNALFGGAKSVQNHVLVGLCYGAQETSNYIKKCYPQVTSFDYIGCSKTVVPYYFSGNLTDDWLNSSLVAIEESYRILGYQKDIIEYLDNKTEGKIIEKNGAILSRIYLNDSNLQNACDL